MGNGYYLKCFNICVVYIYIGEYVLCMYWGILNNVYYLYICI